MMRLFSIYFCNVLYMFQTVFRSIIRSSNLHIQRQVFVWQTPDAVCAGLSSWWWIEKPSETCRRSYRNKGIEKKISIFLVVLSEYGTAVAQWLSFCATNRKVAGSIPGCVIGFFIDIKFFRSHYGSGVDSASNRDEYREYYLGVKAAGA